MLSALRPRARAAVPELACVGVAPSVAPFVAALEGVAATAARDLDDRRPALAEATRLRDRSPRGPSGADAGGDEANAENCSWECHFLLHRSYSIKAIRPYRSQSRRKPRCRDPTIFLVNIQIMCA